MSEKATTALTGVVDLVDEYAGVVVKVVPDPTRPDDSVEVRPHAPRVEQVGAHVATLRALLEQLVQDEVDRRAEIEIAVARATQVAAAGGAV